MLPVFAQFAAVMFFLAGLGLLNLLWLPVLDLSFGIQDLGAIIRAPFQLWMWLFRQLGANGYWPAVYFTIGGGLLLFFLGTLAWLRNRARKRDVADQLVYRLSRHPQYLGWILWSYGAFLLLLQARYPRRSWGIAADLSWLLATMAIVGSLQQIMTVTGVRGLISYAVISTPLMLLYPLLIVLIPVSEGILTYGAAAIIGIPLVWFLDSIGMHATVVIAGLSLLWPLGDGLPPTALIGRLTVMISDYRESYWSFLKETWLPWLVITAVGILMVIFSAKLSFLVDWSM